MSFDAPRILLAGLCQIDLPDETLRLCDGGFVYFGGEKFVSADPVFGAIGEVEMFEEMVGDEAPAGTMTFLPASAASAAELSQPSFQGSRIRFWLVRVDEETGIADEASVEMVADMLLDTTVLKFSRGQRALEIGMISVCERLFTINEGNVLSDQFHKSVWAGESGLANAIDVGMVVAWGIAAPPRGSGRVIGAPGGGGSGGGGGGVSSGGAVLLPAAQF